MTATLLAKELRQHGLALFLLAFLNLIGLGFSLVLVKQLPLFGSMLCTLQAECWFLAITAVILCNRLVVVEYQAQTQLFLEALPLPRSRVFAVKYFLGLFVIGLFAVCIFGVVLVASARTEEFSKSFIALLFARFGLFVWLSYGFFFMAGFLGKYRWAYFGLIIIAMVTLETLSDFDFFRSGPFKLVTGDFPFEHNLWPTDALAMTGIIIGILFVVAWMLASSQEGDVAAKLGERISYREKITLVAVLLGALSAAILVGEKKQKQPYDTADAASASHAAVTVKVSPPSEAAQQVADDLAKDLGAMADFLGIDKLPPVFITERRDLDADNFEHGILANAEGVAVRTNFVAPDWRYVDFLEHMVGESLQAHSNGRIGYEPAFWIVDGFCLYWAHHRAGEKPDTDPLDLDGARQNLWLRALYGSQNYAQPLTQKQHIERWFAWQRRSGHHITAGVGWSGLVSLRDEIGAEKFRAFLSSTLGRATPKNITTTIADLIESPEQRLKNSTGLDYHSFLPVWNRQLERARDVLSEQMRSLPQLEGSFEFEPQSDAGRSFTGEFHFSAPNNSSDLQRPALLYGEPMSFYTQVAEFDLHRYPLNLDPGEQNGSVYQDFTAGTRVSYTFSAHHQVLGCRIISGWQLIEVR